MTHMSLQTLQQAKAKFVAYTNRQTIRYNFV